MKIYMSTKEKSGITLVALVVTIVILLILAGVSINMVLGDSGIITKAQEAKIMTVVSSVKEEIRMSKTDNIINGEYETAETLLAEGKAQRTVQQDEDGIYYMYYALKDGAYSGMQNFGKGNLTSMKDVFLIDDDFNVKYISKEGKEYGDEINNKVLEDDTKIRFSEKAFGDYVSKISGASEDKVIFKWMKNQTSLIISDPSVTSLQDLVFFPNLTNLQIGDYGNNATPNIISMDGIENCTKLQSLSIINGPNKDYTALKNLKDLTNFSRRYGDKKDFDNAVDALKFCDSLKSVSFQNMKIESMKRVNELNDSLEVISFAGNNISKIEGINNKMNLRVLSINDNNITKIENLEKLTNLQQLNLSNNSITDITPLKTNTLLKELNLTGNKGIDGNKNDYIGERLEALNQISKILDNGGNIYLDIDKVNLFNNYTSLEFVNRGLTSIDELEGITELESLNLWGNNLTLEDEKSQQILSSMTKLKTLTLYGNKLTNIKAINNLKNLKSLNIGGDGNNKVNLKEIEDIISNLSSLNVTTENLKTIVNCDVNKIVKLKLAGGGFKEIPDLSKFTNLTELSIVNNTDIVNIDSVSNIYSLKSLNLSNCNLHDKMIDFSRLTNLTSLTVSNNTLWSEDLENLKTLRNNTNLTLDLRNNSIIDASALLDLNPNTKIDLRGNINLSDTSKQELTKRFGNNVMYDK